MSFIPGVGEALGAITGAIGQRRQARVQRQTARRAARAEADPLGSTRGAAPSGQVPTTGARGIGGGLAAPDRDAGAWNVIMTLVQGGGDSAVRAAARENRVSKKDVLLKLAQIQEVDISTDTGMQSRPITGAEKILLSNEIEKIFKGRRRSAVPKALKRLVKQMQFIRRMMGAARSFSGGKGKGR